MTPTFIDIMHRWAYEHYPVEILPQVEFILIGDDNGNPKEVILDSGLPTGMITKLNHEELKEAFTKDIHRIHFNIASPTFFQDIEIVLFRIWGLRACKKPFRTHIEHYKQKIGDDFEVECCPGLLRGKKVV